MTTSFTGAAAVPLLAAAPFTAAPFTATPLLATAGVLLPLLLGEAPVLSRCWSQISCSCAWRASTKSSWALQTWQGVGKAWW